MRQDSRIPSEESDLPLEGGAHQDCYADPRAVQVARASDDKHHSLDGSPVQPRSSENSSMPSQAIEPFRYLQIVVGSLASTHSCCLCVHTCACALRLFDGASSMLPFLNDIAAKVKKYFRTPCRNRIVYLMLVLKLLAAF